MIPFPNSVTLQFWSPVTFSFTLIQKPRNGHHFDTFDIIHGAVMERTKVIPNNKFQRYYEHSLMLCDHLLHPFQSG